jgi:transposase
MLLAVVVTIASIRDRDGAIRLLVAMRAKFCSITLVWADGGYSGRLVVWAKSVLALTVQIVKRNDTVGFTVLPRRWVLERTFRLDHQTPPLCPRLRDHPTTMRPWSTSP